MYYQIISNHEIQAKVIAHVLKKCNCYINDYDNEEDSFHFTHNTWFEDYYRPYIHGLIPIVLDEPVENELKYFLQTQNWDKKVSSNLLDSLISGYIHQYMPQSTLIVVDYALEDLNDDLIYEMTLEEYNSSETLKQNFVENCPTWEIVRVDYKSFISDKSYFKKIMQLLNLYCEVDVETIFPHYLSMQIGRAMIDNKINFKINDT
jgi:hypothetical protein